MAKGRRRAMLQRLLRRSPAPDGQTAEADPWAEYYEELDEETLRELESSITPRAGLAYLAGERLASYETRLKGLEEVFLRTATIPLESAQDRDVQITLPTPAMPSQTQAGLPCEDGISESGSDAGEPVASVSRQDPDHGSPGRATPAKLPGEWSAGDRANLHAGINGRRFDRLEAADKTPWSCAMVPLPLVKRSRSQGDLIREDALRPWMEERGLGRLVSTRSQWSARRGMVRHRSVGDLPQMGTLGQLEVEVGLNRLETSVSAWVPALRRSRSAGDVVAAEALQPQALSDGMNRLETKVSMWKVPPIETAAAEQGPARTRSLGDLREALFVRPQGTADRLNRLETSVSAWTTPRLWARWEEDGAMKPVASVVPMGLEESTSLNRLQTSVWRWTNQQPKNGSARTLRSKKLLLLGDPAPRRYRGTFKRPPRSPLSGYSSDIDSEAARGSIRELMTPSPGGSVTRRRWSLKGIDECSASEAASRLGDGSSTLGSVSRSERSVLLSTRELRASAEPPRGAQYDDEAVTRLIADEPLFRYIITEESAG